MQVVAHLYPADIHAPVCCQVAQEGEAQQPQGLQPPRLRSMTADWKVITACACDQHCSGQHLRLQADCNLP